MENDMNYHKFNQLFLDRNLNQEVNKDFFNYFTSLTNNHPNIVIVLSKIGKVLSLNENKLHALLGKPIVNDEDFQQFVWGDNLDLLENTFNKTLQGHAEKCSIEIKNNLNKTLFLDLTFIPIIIEEDVVGVYLIVTDNTDKTVMKQELMLWENHLNYAQQIAEIGSWEYYFNEDKLICSKNFYNMFGIDYQKYISIEEPFKQIHPEDLNISLQYLKKSISDGENYTHKLRVYHRKTKDLKHFKVHAEVFWEEGKPAKIFGIIKDETYQTLLKKQLIEQNEGYKSIFDNLTSGIWMREKIGGKFLFASKGLEDILEIPLSTLYEDSKAWFNMIQPVHLSELENGKKKMMNGQSFQWIYRINSGKGNTKWLLEEVVPRLNDHGKIANIFGLVTDITYEIEKEHKINYLSNYDNLTGLPNQQSLFKKLDLMCESDEPYAIFYFDLDRFNIINDSLGYFIGDETLKFVADRLEKIMPKDSYLARLSSNDFIMIIRNFENKKEVLQYAKTVIKKIREPFTIQDYELNISTSIGITFYPEEGREKLTLLKNAHTALYKAKKEGKSTYQLSSDEEDVSTYKKYALDRDMRKAILNEEFELHFQPQVETSNGSLCGAEALIRWNHKEWGLVSPGEFIPLAEENHMINGITDWVIEKVCQLLKEWKEKGLPIIPIAINIPPIRFMKKGLFQHVKTQLEHYGIDPFYLEFEITEDTLLNIESSVYSTIQSLKDLGIRIAVDDFGTGYASLASIRKFKPNKIKIDKIFIDNINNEDKVDNGIICATLHLAKSLEMNVVAEGVEEFEQLKFLKKNDCDVIQGYLFSKPLKKEEFENILKVGYLSPQVS
ncbi:sensor domain-containing protein [Solibacillus isronensis]|uniref:sensor domain-containing protein n=1 Tax=Solibacillus isronensis TaxID=412383 RepID=UPI00203B18C8|nr:bifunctional diguanylate cyclase/phosphodiesterase [Solibacillus isronensis]MCM3721309.1 EAL domain-containing protein [Solibacillus isronensis]